MNHDEQERDKMDALKNNALLLARAMATWAYEVNVPKATVLREITEVVNRVWVGRGLEEPGDEK